MLPNRPRLRAGLSRAGIASTSRLTRPLSTPSRPLHPLNNRPPTVQPARVSLNVKTSTNKEHDATERQHFAVLYTKNTRKKHKSWLDGYIIVTGDRYVALHNEDGKRTLTERVPKLGGLVEGNTLEIRSWLIEVQNLVSEEDFLSGRLFLKNVVSERVAPKLCRPFKPLLPNGARRSPAPSRPLHDASAPDAVVLDRTEIPVVLDPCLARRMRAHQVSGVRFLFGCVKPGGGAILADDMGLGKSLQAIALIWTLLRQGDGNRPLAAKAIIVCPASLVTNWVNEVRKWLGADRLKPVAVTRGNSTFESKQALASFVNGSVRKLLIVSYEMFRSYAEDLYRANPGLLVCDEGHRLKSSQGNKTIEALRRLPCRRRVILTGTPVQNDLEEFFAVCDFVNPGCLNSLQSFRSVFGAPIIASRDSNASTATIQMGEARAKELGTITSKFVLRRTSHILERYLPAKSETAIFCRLQPKQEEAYQREARRRFADMDSTRFSAALSAINYLRKICSHPVLVQSRREDEEEYDSDYEGRSSSRFIREEKNREVRDFDVNDSSKMQIAMSLCETSLSAGDKVIFVSNFTSTLDLVQSALVLQKVNFCRLDGSTPVNQRGDIVRRFNGGTLGDIFLLSAKAGGVGLNLIGANRLILFDPDWNPATDLQAMARIWRDGQKKRVFVYRLLSTGTIEEKIYQRQLFKGELQTAVDGDAEEGDAQTLNAGRDFGGKEGNFSAEQLRDLFQYSGKHKFCETLQVLERSQLEANLGSDSFEDDYRVTERKRHCGLLQKFCEYKNLFESENGIEGCISCGGDEVLDKALNGDHKTHGLVSYLFTKSSDTTRDTSKDPVTSHATGTFKKKRDVSDTRESMALSRNTAPKRRKIMPLFDEGSDNDANAESREDSESDPELAVLEAMSKHSSKRRCDGLKAKTSTKNEVTCPDEDKTRLSLSMDGDQNSTSKMQSADINAQETPKNENSFATVCGKTWDDVVNELDCDDIEGFV